jgi:hypothetical protein
MKICRGALTLMLLSASAHLMSGCDQDDAAAQKDDPNTHRTRPRASHSSVKSNNRPFTFVRIQYSGPGRTTAGRSRSRWLTDYPSADLNFSARFQEVTGIETDPNGRVMQLTDADLKQYPFIYIAEGGGVGLSADEVSCLREYLLDGGFLMVDDFWGEDEWSHFYAEVKRVFPDREPVELDLDHPIFSSFYTIREKPQVPMIAIGMTSQSTGITWEREDGKTPHYFGLEDDKGRLMAIFCHNTDLADGWEREGENAYYDQEFVFKKAYPMGINIVVYALTQ